MKILCLVILTCCTGTAVAQIDTGAAPRPNSRQPALIEPLLREVSQLLQREQFQEAYRKAKQARILSQRRGYKARESNATNLLGIAALSLGRITEAIELFQEAATASREAEPEAVRKIQVTALDRAGRLLRMVGRYEESLWCLQQALQLYRRRNDQPNEALMLSHLSAVYADTGDFTKASQMVQEGLPLARRLGIQQLEKAFLMRSMIIAKGRGELPAALEFGEQALALEQRLRAPEGNKLLQQLAMELHYNLGAVYAALDQHQKAITMYEQALQLARETHVPQTQAFCLGEMAWSQFRLGAAQQALDTITESLNLLRQGGGNSHFASKFWFIRAEVQRAMGRDAAALNSYRQAIATIEKARSFSIPTEISRAGIVASRHNVFAGAIEFLLSQQQTAEALEVAEAYHARAFLDVLAETGINSATELSAEQKETEDELFANIAAVQKELWQPELKPEKEAQLTRELQEAETALENFRLAVRQTHSRYKRIESVALIKPARIAPDLLNADTALIEFVLSEKKSFAWVIHQDKLISVTLPAGQEIEALVKEYRNEFNGKINSLTAQQAITKQKAQGRKLYQNLLQPLAAHLASSRKLIIVPDGALAYLPFETLVDENQKYLLEQFAISYAPSASALAALRANSTAISATGFIGFGDPAYAKTEMAKAVAQVDETRTRGFALTPLPYTRREVNDIAALFPPAEQRVFLGDKAQEEAVKREALAQYRYVHFAAHSNVDEEFPARSGIILSTLADSQEDGVLQMSEVMRLKLNADLVTLSACRTGLGKLLNGEGMIGLTRAFFYAGADSVAVSLWNVNDIATASLMKTFYQNLQQGKSKDEALRAAKLQLLTGQQRSWRHPYYWAPFILIGS